jgi:N-acetylmuramoyl-L-alanine amidase
MLGKNPEKQIAEAAAGSVENGDAEANRGQCFPRCPKARHLGHPRLVRWSCWACAALAATSLAVAQAPPAPTGPQARFVVVLDAAHGGDDAGGRLANNQLEKNLALALSARLRSLLTARGIQVVTTRNADTAIDPDKRAETANRAQAQACLTLHTTESGAGVHLFASSLAPMPFTRFAAWKTAQAGWVTRSLALTGVLNAALQHAGMSVTLGRAALPGLDRMSCPAVAVEIAPERDASHKTTATLDDPAYQARVATALAAALLEWRTEAHQP